MINSFGRHFKYLIYISHIVSADASVAPAIDPNYLGWDYDVEALMHIFRFDPG